MQMLFAEVTAHAEHTALSPPLLSAGANALPLGPASHRPACSLFHPLPPQVDKILLEVAGETLSQMAAAPRQQRQVRWARSTAQHSTVQSDAGMQPQSQWLAMPSGGCSWMAGCSWIAGAILDGRARWAAPVS